MLESLSLTGLYTFLYGWIALAVLLVPIQLWVTAPYGRHNRQSWGPQFPNRLGWILMEIISPLVLIGLFLRNGFPAWGPEYIIVGLWTAHYLNRSIIFPLRTRTTGKSIPLVIVLSALFFNLINAGTNGLYLGGLGPNYPMDWLTDPRFLCGLSIFVTGAAINIHADERLLRLRKPGDTTYHVPYGGLFRYISCPNHFGEIVEWIGFAIMCWNLPALAFAIWTAANLVPRALSHHRWYKHQFADYPARRRAVIPFIL